MNELLTVKDLVVRYETDDESVCALNGLSLTVHDGETLGLVGETGAGKTTLARSIMRLVQSPPGVIAGGEILWKGEDLLGVTDNRMREIRGKQISMVFQDPMTSLNPVMTVGDQIAEVLQNHEKLGVKEAAHRACEMLEVVGINASRAGEYPHQFSGGMKQRVVIAIALACRPTLLIADEPTTALDVTIQAQVLEIIKRLRAELNMAMMLITHDLGVVAQNCDNVAIIYAGEIVEYGTVRDIFKRRCHPYTQGLFDSIPKMNEDVARLIPIKGLMPDPTDLPSGCKFHVRCQYATEECAQHIPEMQTVEDTHMVRCIHWQEVRARG